MKSPPISTLSVAKLSFELETLGGQVWMSGADPALFASLANRADRLQAIEGQIRRVP